MAKHWPGSPFWAFLALGQDKQRILCSFSLVWIHAEFCTCKEGTIPRLSAEG